MAFENNVQATLQANVAIGATTVDVVKAVAPNKDVPVSGRLTLSATGKTEIISYTGRTDNTTYWTLTGVTKNAESSFGDQAWSAGDACFQALTAADVASLSTIHSATAPTNPTVGTKWFNTTTGVLQEYLTDGTDFAWLDISAGAVAGASGSSTLSGLSDTTVATTDPLITSNPSAVGHLWINSTTGQAYVCTDITTDTNAWFNTGSGALSVLPIITITQVNGGSAVSYDTSTDFSLSGSSFSYSLLSGSLPTGTSLDSLGVVSGTMHNSTAAYSFTILCTSSDGASSNQTYSWSATYYVAPTGGTITTSGSYTIHTFTSSGSFTVSSNLDAEILGVAGGGGGGGGGASGAGGGGAGGLGHSSSTTLSAGSHSIVIGAGGSSVGSSTHGISGGNSVIGTIAALYGGGGGGSRYGNDPAGQSGGSGGGGGSPNGYAAGGSTKGSSSDLTLYGNLGGSSGSYNGGTGSGGGAGGAGTNGSSNDGGVGLQFTTSGSAVYYAGGGGGGRDPSFGSGGLGGGGRGYTGGNGVDAVSGTANTGGGGGAGGYPSPAGGSGIVIIKYLT